MGCDIDWVVHVKKDGRWEERYPDHHLNPGYRNSAVFGVLGHRFKAKEYGVTPIAPLRGLPEDIVPEPPEDWWADPYDPWRELSCSWLTMDEILGYNWDQTVPINGKPDSLLEWSRIFRNFCEGLVTQFQTDPVNIRFTFGFDQ